MTSIHTSSGASKGRRALRKERLAGLDPNHSPSTLTFTSSAQPNVWITPRWSEAWFPDAFQGPMAELMNAIATGSEPETNGEDNLKTMALVEAGYRSLKERRSVMVSEITESETPAEPEPNSEMK